MKVTIQIEDSEPRAESSGDQSGPPMTRRSDAQAALSSMAPSRTVSNTDSDRAVPASLAERAALIGAQSGGPAPTADALQTGAAGSPGFPPAYVGAPRAGHDSRPTSATAEDLSAGAAPAESSISTGEMS